MENSIKKRIVSGAIWTISGQIGYYGVSIIANIVLARILSPSEFGKIGIALFFISIARVIAESGFGAALIRNKQANDLDFSTIFIFNFFISLSLVSLLVFSSGYIATFYNDSELRDILAFSSFALIINAFQFVQTTKLIREMKFKAKAIYDFIAIVISSTVAILLAMNDYGVWSLVIMQMLTTSINAILLWTFEDRIMSLKFSRKSFLFHYKFGVNTTFASILNSIFSNINQVIIGKYFTIAQTGLYYQANRLQDAPLGVINNINQSVIYAGLSKIQDDKLRFTKAYLNIVRVLTVFTGFVSMVFFVFATEIVVILYGEKWIDSSFFLKILSLAGFFYMQEMFVRNLFKIFNQTAYIIKLEIVKKIVHLICVTIGVLLLRMDVLMYGFLFNCIFAAIINYHISRKIYSFLGYSDLIVLTKLIIIISGIYLIIQLINCNNNFQIEFFLQIAIAILLYFIGLFIFRVLIKDDIKIISSLRNT